MFETPIVLQLKPSQRLPAPMLSMTHPKPHPESLPNSRALH